MVKFLKNCVIVKKVFDYSIQSWNWVDYTVSINEVFDLDEVYFKDLVEGVDYELLS